MKLFISVFLIIASLTGNAQQEISFGNSIYVNLSLGQSIDFNGNNIQLIKCKNGLSYLEINGKEIKLPVAKRTLPVVVDSVRIFIADQKEFKNITSDSSVHALLESEAYICLSDPSKPLLNQNKYAFPISKKDGYTWSMEEDSHMFAYLGLAEWISSNYYRSHEGIDLNMHEARGKELHPLIAIENGEVVLVAGTSITKGKDGCIIIKSEANKNIYYVYKHTNPSTHKVREGQFVKKGDMLSYIWGDQAWGHLHFAVVYREEVPEYDNRYENCLNYFPHMYELYHDDLLSQKVSFTKGNFNFGCQRWVDGNSRRLNSYNELLGYGWDIRSWSTSQSVEGVLGVTYGNARLKKTLHKGTKAASENPFNYFDFLVNVENGIYDVTCTIGDYELPCNFILSIENEESEKFSTLKKEFIKVKKNKVKISDGKLTVRIQLVNEDVVAGIKSLTFEKVSNFR